MENICFAEIDLRITISMPRTVVQQIYGIAVVIESHRIKKGDFGKSNFFVALLDNICCRNILIRFLIASGPDRIDLLLAGLTIMAVLSMLLGNLMALLQGNLKRLLAYSSIAHMGYMMVALIAALKTGNISTDIAAEAIGVYMFAYALMTLLAFAVLSSLAARNSHYETGDIELYRGLLYRHPWLATCLFIAFLGLIGMPLTAGFIGKYYLMLAGVDQQLWMLLWVLVAGSALGLYYYLKVILVICKESKATPASNKVINSGFSGVLIGALCAAVVILGVYPSPVITWVQIALAGL